MRKTNPPDGMARNKKRTAEDALAFVRSLDDQERRRFQETYNREENEPFHRECAGRGLLHLVAKQRQEKLDQRKPERDRDREIVRLRDVEGWSFPRIAERIAEQFNQDANAAQVRVAYWRRKNERRKKV